MNVNDSSQINIISDNLGKRYTIIDFWASWCAPCRNEIPNLKKIYEKYSSEGLQIISISIDKNKEDWSKALEEEKFQWPQFIDNGDFADIYNIRFVPAVFLVDENGILIDENIRGVALEDKIKNLFEN